MSGDQREKKVPPANILSIVTFNVASLRCAWKRGFSDYVTSTQPDIICIQETKMYDKAKPGIDTMVIEGYHAFFLHAKTKGYSGTAVYTKIEPISVKESEGISDENGRCITVEFDKFFLVNTYVINAGQDHCKNLPTKIGVFLPELQRHLEDLKTKKPVIWTGDLNVAHQEIDIWSPKGHEKTAGFTKEERTWFGEFLKTGWVDVFRELYPEKQEFTFFDFRSGRAQNHGWRLDYFVIPRDFLGIVYDCCINQSVTFSDHCPVTLLADQDKLLSTNDKRVARSIVEDISKKNGMVQTTISFT